VIKELMGSKLSSKQLTSLGQVLDP